jgi:2-polyprenyl-6-methoxyphenol hydroxylase-like FAD-dependent oxidoreductase
MDVAIIGGGICGLSLALNLKKRGIAARVYERAPEIKPLGVGITLLRRCSPPVSRTAKAASSTASDN